MRLRYLPLLSVYFTYGASSIGGISMSFWIKEDLSISAMQLASIAIWASMPWTVKMIWGQLVDSVPLFGSRRKAYVYLGALCNAFGIAIIASLAGHHHWVHMFGGQYSTYLVGAVFMALGFAIQDTAADTMSTEVVPRLNERTGKKRPEKEVKADLAMVQVLGRLALSIGILSVAKLSGVLAQFAQAGKTMTYETVFWSMLALPLLTVLGTMFIRLDEDRPLPALRAPLSASRRGEGGAASFDPAIFSAALILGALTIFFGFLRVAYDGCTWTGFFSDELLFITSLSIVSWMVWRLTKEQHKDYRHKLYCMLAALFLFRATPGVGAGFSWWMIDVLHFDPSFFGTLNQISALVPVIVLWLLSDTIAHKPVRSVLLFLIFIGGILSIPDLVLYFGGAGIQAHAREITVISTALASPMVHISMVPLLALIAFYAPAHHRGTWFAVSSSLLNLALTGADLGTKTLNKIFIVTRGTVDAVTGATIPADYSQLGGLLVTAIAISIVVPLIGVVALLPKKAAEK